MFSTNSREPLIQSKSQGWFSNALKPCKLFCLLCLLLTLGYAYIDRKSSVPFENSLGANSGKAAMESTSPDNGAGAVPPSPNQAGPSNAVPAKNDAAGGAQAPDIEAPPPAEPVRVVKVEVQDPPGTETHSVSCVDKEKGYEVQFGPCGRVPTVHAFQRTTFEVTNIPDVPDQGGVCKGAVCTKDDRTNCCRFRQRCFPFYKRDVKQGCPTGLTYNLFEGAYCRTFPCTQQDADICCIKKTGTLFERTHIMRSKYARTEPRMSAPPALPHMSIGFNQMIWTDITRNVTDGDDMWVPLVNFMESWGEESGWKTEAWLRFAEKGEPFYKPFALIEPHESNVEEEFEHPHLRPGADPHATSDE